jgi:hypothetical protein
MQNKANFQDDKNDANSVYTKAYEDYGDSGHEKTNPIQTQFKPKQTQFQKPRNEPKKLKKKEGLRNFFVPLDCRKD